MKSSTSHVCRYICIFALTLALCVISYTGVATAANLQRSGQHVQHNIAFNPIKIGDIEGHIIGTYQNEGLIIIDDGEVGTSVNNGTLDLTNGLGTYSGYIVIIFKDDSSYTTHYEGAYTMTDKGRVSTGTYKFVGGTGRFEGIQGEGSYQQKKYGKMSIVDWKDSISLP
jgi:hypothetical protein